jgi:hypothetical protein
MKYCKLDLAAQIEMTKAALLLRFWTEHPDASSRKYLSYRKIG